MNEGIELYYCWTDDEKTGWLSRYDDSGDHCREATSKDKTGTRLAEYLDQQCENDNYHGMVGANAWLLKAIEKHAGKTVAKAIMEEIHNVGGLMNAGGH